MKLLRILFAFLTAAVFVSGPVGCQSVKQMADENPEAVSEIAENAVAIGATVIELIRMRGEPDIVATIGTRSGDGESRRYVYEDMVYITKDGVVVDKFPTPRSKGDY